MSNRVGLIVLVVLATVLVLILVAQDSDQRERGRDIALARSMEGKSEAEIDKLMRRRGLDAKYRLADKKSLDRAYVNTMPTSRVKPRGVVLKYRKRHLPLLGWSRVFFVYLDDQGRAFAVRLASEKW